MNLITPKLTATALNYGIAKHDFFSFGIEKHFGGKAILHQKLRLVPSCLLSAWTVTLQHRI